MTEPNTHKCIGTIKEKVPKTIKGGTTFVIATIQIGEDELDIEFWDGKFKAKSELEFCPIGSKVEVHSFAKTREWISERGYVNRTTKVQARSVTNLGAPIKQDEPPPPEGLGDDIAF